MPDHDPLTLKLSLKEKIAYGAGDIGSNLRKVRISRSFLPKLTR